VVAIIVVLGVAFGGYEVVRPRPSLNADTYSACRKLRSSKGGSGIASTLTTDQLQRIAKLGVKSNNAKIRDASEELASATGTKILLGTLALSQACSEVGIGLTPSTG
jgi:hypothetical protein